MDGLSVFRDSPLLYTEHILGQEPRPWQGRLMSVIADRLRKGQRHIRVHVRCCHGAGKTWLASALLLWYMTTREGSRGLTTAPTWAQVSGLLWPEIRSMHGNSRILRLGKVGEVFETPRFQLGPKWFAVGASSDKPENLEGHHAQTAAIRIIDEAKAVPSEIRLATQGLLDAPETFDLAISTPWTRSGWYYEQDALSGDDDLIRCVVPLGQLIEDGDRPESLREAWEREFGGRETPHYRARVDAEYIEADPFGAINLASLEACMKDGAASSPGAVVVGLDVARSEDGDESVIAVAHGNAIVRLYPLRVKDTVTVAREAVRIAHEHRAEVIRVDAVGVGGGPVDIIRAEGFPGKVEEFVAGAQAGDPTRFSNRYAEAADDLIRRINAREVSLPNDERLRAQALQIRYEPAAGGKLKVDKAPGTASSPDRWDACLIALATPTISQSDRILAAFQAMRGAERKAA